MRKVVGILLAALGMSAARADSLPAANPFTKFAQDDAVIAAVQTTFVVEAGKHVRLSVYDSKEHFLEMPAMKHEGELDETGLALVALRGLTPGEYAFVAYLDEDGDGKLKRGGVLGRPKEPLAFSNGVVPKLRKPRFDETKVLVEPGSVVVITLKD